MPVLTATGPGGSTRLRVDIEGPRVVSPPGGLLGEAADALRWWRFEVYALGAGDAPLRDAMLVAELVEDARLRLRFKDISHGGERKLARLGVPDALYRAVACDDLLGLGPVVLVSSKRGGDTSSGDFLTVPGGKVWMRFDSERRAKYVSEECRWHYVCGACSDGA